MIPGGWAQGSTRPDNSWPIIPSLAAEWMLSSGSLSRWQSRAAALRRGDPWELRRADLGKAGNSCLTNAGVDNALGHYKDFQRRRPGITWDKAKPALIPPVYRDLRGFPPTILISGTCDLFSAAMPKGNEEGGMIDLRSDLKGLADPG